MNVSRRLVYHPNVSSVTGAICLDILKDQWSPALTMKTALISLQALMCAPEPDDPQDAVVANVYKTNRTTFDATAREWAITYAGASGEVPAAAAAAAPPVSLRAEPFFEHCSSRILIHRSTTDSSVGPEADGHGLLSGSCHSSVGCGTG
jgi:hypothetical protein